MVVVVAKYRTRQPTMRTRTVRGEGRRNGDTVVFGLKVASADLPYMLADEAVTRPSSAARVTATSVTMK